ncbi:kinase [Paraglaciecola sp.]|uniref:kinase n=1 Tax=Paraglaciecola sp. TaxID=1920173 RepID=UPI00273F9432|nr:kinase [Paraglaciecola sp.]
MENDKPMIEQFINEHKLSSGFITTAKRYYTPLADRIALHQKEARKTYYVGINGCQGSGKSTLGDFLGTYLKQRYQLNVVILSLDDFYLNQSQRLTLAASVHPLFKTRGVPGTHNTALMHSVLTALSCTEGSLALPKFNKANDNPFPEDQWSRVTGPVDIVILEGWCWGVTAQSPQELTAPVNELEVNEDPQATWRTYVNQQLASCYEPLYQQMHYWVMLKAPDFSNVFNWRLEQEQKLAASLASTSNTQIMNAQQIERFIQFYQRLTEHGLSTLPSHCNEVFELNSQRKIMKHITQSEQGVQRVK